MNEQIKISHRQAVQNLAETNMIRVLKSGEVPGLVERFVPRDQIVRLIAECGAEEVGSEAQKRGFSMSLKNGEDIYFIESKSND